MSVFAANLNGPFQVQDDSGSTVGLQLLEVQPAPAAALGAAVAEDAANERFSLLFGGPLAQPLEQGCYSFEAQGIGRFALFIVPIGTTETTHCYYEAIFNRPAGGPLPRAGQGHIPLGRGRRARRGFEPSRTR